MFYDIFNFFPIHISNIIKNSINNNEQANKLEEIRIRSNQNIILKLNNNEIILNYNVTSKDILDILQIICENSIYSYQKEIGQGYITVKGGHRIGITGNCVMENRKDYKYKLYLKFKFQSCKTNYRL